MTEDGMAADAGTDAGARTLPDPLAESVRLVDAADRAGLLVRLVGGMAVRAHVPHWGERTRRVEVDLDFATRARDRTAFYELLEAEGYEPDRRHNALFGRTQGYFVDPARNRPVDVIVDRLEMCHRLELADRLAVSRPTLPLADLLLSKLQVVRINRKDVLDALILLAEHPLGEDDGPIDSAAGLQTVSIPRITSVTSTDWGWWRTVTENLDRLHDFIATEMTPDDMDIDAGRDVRFDPRAQVAALRAAIDAAPKTSKWRLRARIGDRVRWYAEPEEVAHGPG